MAVRGVSEFEEDRESLRRESQSLRSRSADEETPLPPREQGGLRERAEQGAEILHYEGYVQDDKNRTPLFPPKPSLGGE